MGEFNYIAVLMEINILIKKNILYYEIKKYDNMHILSMSMFQREKKNPCPCEWILPIYNIA